MALRFGPSQRVRWRELVTIDPMAVRLLARGRSGLQALDRGGRGWEECVRSKKEPSQGNRIEDESGFGEVHCDRLVGT